MNHKVNGAWVVVVTIAAVVTPAGCALAGRPTAPAGTATPTGTVAATGTGTGAAVDREWQERGFAEKRGITLAEGKRRLGWQAVAPDLAARLGQQPYFAGVWIDVRGGDRVKVGVAGQVTSDVAAEIDRGAKAVGMTEGYDVVPLRFPLSALNEANDWLGSQLVLVNAGATAKLSAGLRTDLNAVQLQTPSQGTLTPKQQSLLTAAKARLGDRVVVSTFAGRFVQLGCQSSNCAPPLRGGTDIHFLVGNDFEFCTGGFIAKGRVDLKLYLMTAGHCVVTHHSGNWTAAQLGVPGDHVIGPVWNYEDSDKGDYAILQIEDVSTWNPKPWVAYGMTIKATRSRSISPPIATAYWVCRSATAAGRPVPRPAGR